MTQNIQAGAPELDQSKAASTAQAKPTHRTASELWEKATNYSREARKEPRPAGKGK
jgi:hypothetical protein